ncbi:hypothetical protein PanWU01x14_049030 [Parasponia andersonii]|uniref:Uncharacterized protein n=1 Tax=Parasponia andersonii TaxID=3476 RepID=A0A2P5DMI6_PARAD|nr:hypothetical protein PanWU01x14_049030 [Parasponia andersonii]
MSRQVGINMQTGIKERARKGFRLPESSLVLILEYGDPNKRKENCGEFPFLYRLLISLAE